MKKKLLLAVSLMSLGALAGCGSGGSSSSGSEPKDPLDIPGFNKEYLPKKEQNRVKQITGGQHMTITVALNYEGSLPAWKELGKEYERLCGNAVTIDIKDTGKTDKYIEDLHRQETNSRTEWDIVSGNLLAQSDMHAVSLADSVEGVANPYAGNKYWDDLLETKAYRGDSAYMLNSEDLLTGWFVNTAATKKAGLSDEQAKPKTWEELISVLDSLQKAGYKYPLGLSLTSDSIEGSQFAWLLRIYGDYYFRSYYQYISKTWDTTLQQDTKFTYDPTNINIESNRNCDRSYSRMFCTMLDEGCPNFCGPTSEIFEEFVGQFAKLRKYIDPSAGNYAFDTVRTNFMSQSVGGSSANAPQIVLDYSGKGLQYIEVKSLKDHVEVFDYPKMESELVPADTEIRDVGGSGGYLSILNASSHSRTRINLAIDFLKYVLSPYGQTIYYRALKQYNLAPQGLTTVKNDLVVIPESWVEFFQNPTLKYNGRADNNKYLTYGVLGLESFNYDPNDKDNKYGPRNWKTLLTGDGSYDAEDFNTDWLNILLAAWPSMKANHSSWPADAYKASHYSEANYIKEDMR